MMKLTRRDAMIALAGGVGATAGVGGVTDVFDRNAAVSLDSKRVDRLSAVADVVYPSEVDATREFVETYVVGRTEDRDDYRDGMVSAVDTLARESNREYGREVSRLAESRVERLLRELGVDTAHPVPDGTVAERIRYYVVNDLLYALYTTPVGGRLVGYENPDGYPGGTEAYQREGPE